MNRNHHFIGTCAWVFLFLVSSCTPQQDPPFENHERKLPVSVGEAIQRDVPIYLEAIGSVVPVIEVEIRPQVRGTIIDMFFKGGDNVKVGDPLYRIDPLPFLVASEKAQATLIKDKAQLVYAKQRLERYENLVKSDFVSKLTLEEYTKDVKAQEAQVLIDEALIQEAKINLDYATLVAPITGKIGLGKVDKGNYVTPIDTKPLITLFQMSPIYVNFSLSQKEFQHFQKVIREGNRKFEVLLPYGSDEVFEGDVEAIDNQVSTETGTIRLRGKIDNEKELLWPGEFVRVRLQVDFKKNAVLVPSEAVQLGQKGYYVYVLNADEMTVDYVPVKVGESIDDSIIIEEGLTAGTKVVTDGQINLIQGAKVFIADQENHENTSPVEEQS